MLVIRTLCDHRFLEQRAALPSGTGPPDYVGANRYYMRPQGPTPLGEGLAAGVQCLGVPSGLTSVKYESKPT